MTIARFDTRFGPILAMHNDQPIVDSLDKYGEWAQIEIEFLTQFIPDDGVVLDCGSHVGVHSLAFAYASERAHVHSFEAQPQIADLLARNTEALGDRVVVHQCAVGGDQDANAGVRIFRSPASAIGYEVPIKTIDSFHLSGIKFIRLEIEGCEAAALRGAAHAIATDRPAIYCKASSISAAADLFRAMEGCGYKCYFVLTPSFNPENFRSAPANLFGAARKSALLFLPADRRSPGAPREGICAPVRNLDEFAAQFFFAVRFFKTPQSGKYKTPQGKVVLDLAAANELNQEIRVGKQRHNVLAQFIWKSDIAARRRSILGAAARRFGRSEMAKACRVLTGSGLFDRKWYKRTYGNTFTPQQEPVVHYLLLGAFDGRKPNRVFDSSYYLSENPDVRLSGINPLLHYIKWGEREMRRPSADFDPAAYLDANPSLKGSNVHLLKHFLDNGTPGKPIVPPYKPFAPVWGAFEALSAERKISPREPAILDIIVPVYRGYDDTLSCLFSVLTSRNATPFELIVIDDASSEPALSEALRRLAGMELITLLRNEQNLGFVSTVNRGMTLHEARDVLLLNSDTLVFNDWLDRIRAHGLRPDVATVTPFTNSGTICSYPEFCRDNPNELEISFSELDLMAAHVNRQQWVEVPTGVGFCMYITRRALREIGLFDVETFGKGYGEENDFCVNAAKRGMRNIHALDAFVFHSGETSFGPDASKAKEAALNALAIKHPGYLAEVNRYIAADPAKGWRAKLDVARMLKGAPERIILCFTHSMGGGIERYLRDRAASAQDTGVALLLAVPQSQDGAAIRLTGVDGRPVLPNLPDFVLGKDDEAFTQLLLSLPVSAIEVHSTVGWSARVLQSIPVIARSLGMPFDFMAHDYTTICPQITLINTSRIYCGEEGEEQCRRCLHALAKAQRAVHPDVAHACMSDIVDWRANYERFLKQAREVAAPSEDTAKRLQKYFPEIRIVSRPHKETVDSYARHVAAPCCGGVVRVVVIGAIGPHKGAEILRKCADDAERRRLPIHFTVVGYTSPDLAGRSNVNVTGAYAEHEVFDLLAEVGGHIALLPSVWPETYSYTLSIAKAGGLPVCAFDIGAQGERLRAANGGILLPVSMMTDTSRINDALVEAIEKLQNTEFGLFSQQIHSIRAAVDDVSIAATMS